MAALTEKKYYETWEQFMVLLEKKKFNDSFVDEKEFEEKRKELLEMVSKLKAECEYTLYAEIREAKKVGLRIDDYNFTREQVDDLQFLYDKLQYQCEDIVELDWRGTYFKQKINWFKYIAAIVAIILYFCFFDKK